MTQYKSHIIDPEPMKITIDNNNDDTFVGYEGHKIRISHLTHEDPHPELGYKIKENGIALSGTLSYLTKSRAYQDSECSS